MKRTVTEEFNEDGKLVKRTTVEDSADPVILPQPAPTPPYTPSVLPGTWWQQLGNVGGCAACSRSGVCNCVNPPGAPQISCTVDHHGGPCSWDYTVCP